MRFEGLYGVPHQLMPPLFQPTRESALEIAGALAVGVPVPPIFGRGLSEEERISIVGRLFPDKIFDVTSPLGYRLQSINRDEIFAQFVPRLASHRDDVKSVLQANQWIMRRSGVRLPKAVFRSAEVMVGVNSINAHGFVAPRYDVKSEVAWLLNELQTGVHDFLASVALFVWFFLHVHPFADGNGRTFRMLLLRFVGWRWGTKSPCHDAVHRLLDAMQAEKNEFIYAMHRSRLSDAQPLRAFILRAIAEH